MRALALACAFACACSSVNQCGGDVGGTLVEYTACPTDLIDCGHVFVCGDQELCINDDDDPEQLDSAGATFGACAPTERHQGLCLYCCGPDCGRGCNAFMGCYCP